ncbi:RTA1-domain-containing protein [Lophiostoma macrostomum CBS 122681]|uniref:RTA1-domain-containing protein n=1 Tax=Lophiostoma macrostomum CBS 122681 TaxID=1314788 RepID=A0A6A6TKZ6_9PLEO|nr:RTA1-domain-containing protein [Lophiostoma macrostomum CBS 122681]
MPEHHSLDDPNAWIPYRYVPSKVAAIIFVVLFSLTTALHIFQLFKKRTWYFVPLIIGGLFESVGYIGRVLSSNDVWKLGPFIMQSLLLLVAPALFAASIYIILGRVILLVDGERYSLVRQRWLTVTFVCGDVLSFLVQSGGGGIQAMGTLSSMHTGEKLIVVGLALQLVFFGFFIIVAGLFHYRLVRDKPSRQISLNCFKRHSNTSDSRSLTATPPVDISTLPWKRHMYALYISSLLILVRSIFRIAEYVQGNNGYLLRHEVFIYLFDAVLMLAVMVLFNVVHPSEVTENYMKWKMQGAGEELRDTRESHMSERGQEQGEQKTAREWV